MKVLFVHDHKIRKVNGSYYSPGGLPQKVLMRYINAFGPLTLLTRIYEEKESRNTYSLIDDPDISFVNFRVKPLLTTRKQVQNSDFIIARLPSISGFIAVEFCRLLRKKYLVEIVGDPYTSYKFSGKTAGLPMAVFATLFMKSAVRRAPYVSYVSKRFLQDKYPTKGYSIGIPDVFLEAPDEMILRKRLNRIAAMDRRAPVLGLIGSLDVNYRGQKTALNTVKYLEKNKIYASIRFLGSGDSARWAEYAENLGIGDRVMFDGVLPAGEKVYEWMDHIDILIMPTKAETLGRAIIEAMSRGCPVIGSAETAIGEQIGSDCLAMSDDYIAFSDIVTRMMDSGEYIIFCAKENFYRSFKYTNEQTDFARNSFFQTVKSQLV